MLCRERLEVEDANRTQPTAGSSSAQRRFDDYFDVAISGRSISRPSPTTRTTGTHSQDTSITSVSQIL